jgi:hypothetical protein
MFTTPDIEAFLQAGSFFNAYSCKAKRNEFSQIQELLNIATRLGGTLEKPGDLGSIQTGF